MVKLEDQNTIKLTLTDVHGLTRRADVVLLSFVAKERWTCTARVVLRQCDASIVDETFFWFAATSIMRRGDTSLGQAQEEERGEKTK